MELFKEDYGRLGKLHRSEWKKLLNSNKDLFKRIKSAPPSIIGPQLDEHGEVIADLKLIETVFFEKVANKNQHDFFKELKKVNPPAADEYMLTIGGAIERWKEDMKRIEFSLHQLKKGEHVLEKEEKRLIREEIEIKDLIETLKRHIPNLIKDIELKGLNFTELLNKIRMVEQNINSKESRLKSYLKKRKHEMPFLFE